MNATEYDFGSVSSPGSDASSYDSPSYTAPKKSKTWIAIVVFLVLAVVAVAVSMGFAFAPAKKTTPSTPAAATSPRGFGPAPDSFVRVRNSKEETPTHRASPASLSGADTMALVHSGKPIEVNESGLAEFLKLKRPSVLAFVSQRCHFCREMMPKYQEAAAASRIPFLVVQAEQAGALMQRYNIRGFPTVLRLGPNGEKIKEHTGERSLLSYIAFAG